MAAPATKTIKDLTGTWVINKTLSDSTEPVLALQGVGWLTRKAIGAATVTLHVKQYEGLPGAPSTSTAPVTHVDIEQTVTGGLKGNAEARCLDYEFREHSDWLFGHVRGQSRWAGPADLAALVADKRAGGRLPPAGTNDADAVTSDWLEGESEAGGPAGESHIWNYVESLDAGWTVVQVWGFQTIGGERRHVRSVVAAKDGKFVSIKLIYDWVPE
ncbi:hypothetical protein F4779DRAFT_417164 [Xylariaceae sp. FL0662B]|nr:hypothetical protein F4779DRAFT_417164 [Xylariaceae sp. FL0662B]